MDKMTLDKLPKKVLAKIDFQTAFIASRFVISAERLQIFRILHGKKLTADQVGNKVKIHPKHREPFLNVLLSLGLLTKVGKRYKNSALADKYFVKERSPQWTTIYSGENLEEYESFLVLEEILTSGRNCQSILGKKRQFYMERMRSDRKWADDFTRMLFYHHQDDAKKLAQKLNLTGYTNLLDVGGGSGVMSIALARKFKSLKATVLDIGPVCDAAKRIIRKERMGGRVKVLCQNMNRPFPKGFDVIMFCDIGLIKTSLLTKAFKSLPTGGLVVLVDEFASDDGTEPLNRLMMQIRSKEPWIKTRAQVVDDLKSVGFRSVKKTRLHNELWLILGQKR